jgi:hypothetical protein
MKKPRHLAASNTLEMLAALRSCATIEHVRHQNTQLNFMGCDRG